MPCRRPHRTPDHTAAAPRRLLLLAPPQRRSPPFAGALLGQRPARLAARRQQLRLRSRVAGEVFEAVLARPPRGTEMRSRNRTGARPGLRHRRPGKTLDTQNGSAFGCAERLRRPIARTIFLQSDTVQCSKHVSARAAPTAKFAK